MTARIETVAVGKPRTVRHRGKDVSTGIFKEPVKSRVRVGLNNIEGDGQADLSVHGGRDKAVYAYPYCHYAAWARELGVDALEPAQFGENLSVSGLDEAGVIIGDRYRAGTATFLVTQPRIPCFKLGIRLGDDRFPPRFLASGRPGFYLRVIDEGEIGAGDHIELVDRPDHGISVYDLWCLVFGSSGTPEGKRRALESLPYLDAGWVRRLG